MKRLVTSVVSALAVIAGTCPLVLAVPFGPGRPQAAAADTPGGIDVDLNGDGSLTYWTQTNPGYGPFLVGPNEDEPLGRCGCFLTAAANVMQYYTKGLAPHFPTPMINPGSGQIESTLEFTPYYVHRFLRDGIPGLHAPTNWGYPKSTLFPGEGCDAAPNLPALSILGTGVRPTPGGPLVVPTGYTVDIYPGLDKPQVDAALLAGHPVIAGVKRRDDQGNVVGRHAQLIIGARSGKNESDPTRHFPAYKVSDPISRRLAEPDNDQAKYAEWEADVDMIMVTSPATKPARYLMVKDDPSPIELLSINPDGRRTGFDRATATELKEDAAASYAKLGPWQDVLGVGPPGNETKSLYVRDPVDGTYRFEVTGTADGHYALSFETMDEGGRTTVLRTVDGTIAPGSIRRFEAHYSATGTTIEEVAHFSPDARAGTDVSGHTDETLTFDGGASAGVGSTVASYDWAFGDGSTGSGRAVQHAYATPGVYNVTLTVTDELGSTATDHLVAYVSGTTSGGKETVRVSVAGDGAEATGDSRDPATTPDGRFVAFTSNASNLVPGDTNGAVDVFVRDVPSGSTERVNISSAGEQAAGTFGDAGSWPTLSADGRFVAFTSRAGNLASDDANGADDVFVHDRQTGATERIVPSDRAFRPMISGDGRLVTFSSDAALVADDTNGAPDVYVHDRATGTTERASVSSTGQQAERSASGFARPLESRNPTTSADGRFVAFESNAVNLVPGTDNFTGGKRIYVRDRALGTTELVSRTSGGDEPGTAQSFYPSISGDGRFVAFQSQAALVPEDTNGSWEDAYVRDREQATTSLVSVSTGGVQAETGGVNSRISANGRFVTFYSSARSLVPGDTNGDGKSPPAGLDVFVRDVQAGTTDRVSVSTAGDQATPDVGSTGFTNEGRRAPASDSGDVAFESSAANLVAGDTNGANDVFLRRQPAPTPLARPSGPYVGWAAGPGSPAAITFDGTGSDAGTPGAALTARWDFGDGSPALTGTDLVVSHSYPRPGRFVATLTVDNGGQPSHPVSTDVEVFPPLPAEGLVATPACADPGGTVGVRGFAGAPNAALRDEGWNLAHGPLDPQPVSLSFSWGGGVEVRPALPTLDIQATVALPSTLPAGTHSVNVEVAGGPAASVTVPCAVDANSAPVADAGGPFYTAAVGSAVRLDGGRSTDADGDALTYAWDFGDGQTGSGVTPAHVFAHEGTFVVTLVVNDGSRDSRLEPGPAFALVSVGTASNRAPDCAAVRPDRAVLWPPNGQFVNVTLAGATDPDGDAVTVKVTGVTQDEPVGRTAPDAQLLTEPAQVRLRAERDGTGDGRVYTVSFEVADGKGGSCTSIVTVAVPHDERGRPAVDSGLAVNALPVH